MFVKSKFELDLKIIQMGGIELDSSIIISSQQNQALKRSKDYTYDRVSYRNQPQ